MRQNNKKKSDFRTYVGYLSAFLLFAPVAAFAQASPFNTGANSLVNFALTIATPIAALIVIGLANPEACR